MSNPKDIQEKQHHSHAARFVALGMAIVAAAAAVFYFGYWVRTPQYAMHNLLDAVRARDIAYVDQHVDEEQFFSHLFEESLEFAFGAEEGDSDQQANPALKRYLTQSKELVIPILRQQVRNWIISGTPDNDLPVRLEAADMGRGTAMARTMATNLGLFRLQYRSLGKVEKKGDTALAELTFRDKQLDQDLPVTLQLRRKDGTWKVVSAANLAEYLEARQKAIRARLDTLNAPLKARIAKSVVVSTDEDKAPLFRVHDDPSAVTGASLEGEFTLSNIGDTDILSTSGTVEVKDASGTVRFRNGFESEGIPAGQSVRVRNVWPLDLYIPNQSILATKPDEKLTADMTIQYVIFKGGQSIGLLETLPDEAPPRR